MKRYVIGAGMSASGVLFCAATDRTHNIVYVYESAGWRRLVNWAGHEATACCACGETIVCAALDDVVYLIDGTTISRVTLPEHTRTWVRGACALTRDTALLGGAGGLFHLSTADQTAARKRLGDLNVSRPGRDINNVVPAADGRTWILGVKNLLVDYRGDAATEPVPRDALRGRELMFGDAVELDGHLWLSAREGPRALIAQLAGHRLTFHDAPQPGQSLARIGALGGELLVSGDKLSAGRPGGWRDLPTPASLGGFVALVSQDGGGASCAVASNGQSVFTDGRSCREVPIF